MRDSVLLFLATLGPVGRLPIAPGTWGSLCGCVLGWVLSTWSLPVQMGLILMLAVLGLLAAEKHVQLTGKQDAQEVVIDEVVGQSIALVALPFSIGFWLLGFLLFRLLDIWKPFPIGWLDRRVKGGVGIMSDDIAAGLIASLLLQILARTLPL